MMKLMICGCMNLKDHHSKVKTVRFTSTPLSDKLVAGSGDAEEDPANSDSDSNCSDETAVSLKNKRVVFQGTYPIDRPVSEHVRKLKRQQMTLTLKSPRTFMVDEPIGLPKVEVSSWTT